jgi:CysZ protein
MELQAQRRGLLDGVAALWFGIRFVAGRREIWPYAAAPALVAAVLSTTLSVLGAVLAYKAFHHYLTPHPGGGLASFLLGALALLAAALGLLLGAVLGFSLAVPLSGPALERIARAVFAELGVPLPPEDLAGTLANLISSLAATALGLLLSLGPVAVLAAVGAIFPVTLPITLPLKLGLLALLLTWDLGDHAFSCIGLRLSQRLGWIRANLGAALSFGGLASLLLCVPGLGLLILPCGVAGAARLLAFSRGSAPARTAA